MHMSEKGQVTIPHHIRKAMGLTPHVEVDIQMRGDEIIVRKSSKNQDSASSTEDKIERALLKARTAWTKNLTTEDVMRATRGWE